MKSIDTLMQQTRDRLAHWAMWRPMLERFDYILSMCGETLESRMIEMGPDGATIKGGGGKSDGGAFYLYSTQIWAADNVAQAREVQKLLSRMPGDYMAVAEAYYPHGDSHAAGDKTAARMLTQKLNKAVTDREACKWRVHVETRIADRLFPMQAVA